MASERPIPVTNAGSLASWDTRARGRRGLEQWVPRCLIASGGREAEWRASSCRRSTEEIANASVHAELDVRGAIAAAYDALGPNHASRVHYGGGQKTLREWAGILSGRGWRPGSSTSKHASGSAVDLNYSMQPYIVTRPMRCP